MLTLAPHQTQAITRVLNYYEVDGIQRQLVQMATGAGKTITAAALASQLRGQSPSSAPWRCLFLAHRDTLLTQAFEAFSQFFPLGQLGIVQAEKNTVATPIIFASVQTLAQPRRLRELLRYGKFNLVICDEAHHATSPTYRRLLGTVEQPNTTVMTPDALLVGLTATPRRSDNVSLRKVFEQVSFSVGILELMTLEPDPWLVDLKSIAVEIPDLDLKSLIDEDEEGDFDQEQLEKAIERSIKSKSRYTQALNVLHRYPEMRGLQGVYFGASVADAYGFADMANAARITTEVVTGNTRDEDRVAIYDRVRRGETQYLSNMNVLPEGVDLPMLQVAIIGYHTRFIGRYIQMIGRITRIHPTDRGRPSALWQYPVAYVIDLTDNDHTVVMLPDMIGTTEEQTRQKSVKQLVKDGVIEAKPVPKSPVYTPGNTPVRVAGASVFTNQPWKRQGDDYKLVKPNGTYIARHTLGGSYEVLFYPKGGTVQQLRKPVALEPALGFAQQHLERAELREDRRSDPATRARPASPDQIAKVARVFRFVKPDSPLTQGAVQDLWDGLRKTGSVGNWHKSQAKSNWFGQHGRLLKKS